MKFGIFQFSHVTLPLIEDTKNAICIRVFPVFYTPSIFPSFSSHFSSFIWMRLHIPTYRFE